MESEKGGGGKLLDFNMLLYIWARVFCEHAPQFAEDFPMSLSHDSHISQVTYFKHRAHFELQGVYIPTPSAGEIIQVAFPMLEWNGELYTGCVRNSTETPSTVSELQRVSSTVEPFTQTEYYLAFDSKLPVCTHGYAIYGTFTHPWSIVVGTKETFTPIELFSFPIYSGKLHGSWWNEKYMYQVFFVSSLVLGAVFGFRNFVGILFFASAADRLSHAFTWISLVDIIPGLLIILNTSGKSRTLAVFWWAFIGASAFGVIGFGGISNIVVGAVILLGIWLPKIGRPLACVFLFGSGYFMGPLALLILNAVNIHPK